MSTASYSFGAVLTKDSKKGLPDATVTVTALKVK